MPVFNTFWESTMKKITVLFAVTALALAGSVMAAAPKSPQVEYSADTMIETAEVSMHGHVNFTPMMERREMVMGSGGDKMITITRQDKKVAWTLMPSEKMYMEISLADAKSKDAGDTSQYKIEQTVVGPETVNGVETTKSKIMMTGPKGEKMGGFMWTTKDDILVKMDAIAVDQKDKRRFKTELTNLKVGPQDRALFDPPTDYQKMGMPDLSDLFGTGGDSGEGDKDSESGKGGGFSFGDLMKQLK